MTIGLLGRKVGMTQVFDFEGSMVPVTIIELGPNTVVQVKTEDGSDGYNAIKVGFGDCDTARLNRPDAGVWHRAKLDAKKHICEFRLDDDEVGTVKVGTDLQVTRFRVGEKVDVIGTSKGKGFQGVVKRHHFKGAKEMTHGTHEYKRHAGSIGCSAWPARVIKGRKMAGRMGTEQVTVQGISVVAVYPEDNLLLVKGGIPGGKNGLVQVVPSFK